LIDLPEHAPDALFADKACDSDAIRDDLKKRGIKAVIPPKSNRKVIIRNNKRLYCQRNWIERVIGHLKINRAIAYPTRSTRKELPRHAIHRNRALLDQIFPRCLARLSGRGDWR
jgi:hypothetical protein